MLYVRACACGAQCEPKISLLCARRRRWLTLRWLLLLRVVHASRSSAAAVVAGVAEGTQAAAHGEKWTRARGNQRSRVRSANNSTAAAAQPARNRRQQTEGRQWSYGAQQMDASNVSRLCVVAVVRLYTQHCSLSICSCLSRATVWACGVRFACGSGNASAEDAFLGRFLGCVSKKRSLAFASCRSCCVHWSCRVLWQCSARQCSCSQHLPLIGLPFVR